ncbi:MAG: hypothetical protein J2P48_06335 [Alphaproteobacteria bacterium]|nr:hypothetical protein [Alphaproteobacteria bacterium]
MRDDAEIDDEPRAGDESRVAERARRLAAALFEHVADDFPGVDTLNP